jgi:TaqI-like C-terminal specificity domain/Eco57I restriction-modification methylase
VLEVLCRNAQNSFQKEKCLCFRSCGGNKLPKTRLKPTKRFRLGQQWPDRWLCRHSEALLRTYEQMVASDLKYKDCEGASKKAYKSLCRSVRKSVPRSNGCIPDIGSLASRRCKTVAEVFASLRQIYRNDWLQSVASILGMLMHYSVSNRTQTNHLRNQRRPKQMFSSYPNSPALVQVLARYVVDSLITLPIPLACFDAAAAERWAARALNFKVVDPSMESGQLLVGIAETVINRVHRIHGRDSKPATRLIPALLERLCSHCLWGIDRNRRAIDAVTLVFNLLGDEYRLKNLRPTNLLAGDALDCVGRGPWTGFDAIINNPPWGESLRPTQRAFLHDRFTTIRYHADTYVAFGELALRCLIPNGLLALVLPSQMLAAQNAGGLRKLFAHELHVEEIMLLPHAAFAQATVRGLVLLGRRKPTKSTQPCRVAVFPMLKTMAYAAEVHLSTIDGSVIPSVAGGSWWRFIAKQEIPATASDCVTLSNLGRVISGVKAYTTGQGCPPQTRTVVQKRKFDLQKNQRGAQPVISGRDILRFQTGLPRRYIKFGRWLAHPGEHKSLLRLPRIFVREIFKRDGTLTAAIARDGVVPLHGVLTIVPRLINPYVLTAILNSKGAAAYVRSSAASFSKVDFQKITIGELKSMPIPIAAIDRCYQAQLGFNSWGRGRDPMQKRLAQLAKQLQLTTPLDANGAFSELESIVDKLYRRKTKPE